MTELNISLNRHLPPELKTLPIIRAEVAHTIALGSELPSLEGPVFDRYGNFYCCHTVPDDTRIMQISPDGRIREFYHFTEGMTVGLAFHQDGRCFATDMRAGCIRVLSTEGILLDTIHLSEEGRQFRPDCMVFRNNGDLLFTDLSGNLREPIGGVYLLSADSNYHQMKKFIGNLASPNGITVSPEGSSLWISESGSNSILRYRLDPQGNPRLCHNSPEQAFRNTGYPNVDTHSMDENGYCYVAVMFGGRAVVLDPEGIPVCNILVPGFEEGKLQFTPNLALNRNKCEGYLLASDSERAVILRFPSLAPGQKLFAYLNI